MPFAHVESVIAALSEPWFYGGPRNAGSNYGKELKQRFDAFLDKGALDIALGLGGYLIHTEANKQQRMALRAVMLAYVLMRNRPITDLPAAKKTFESLSLDALKRAFVNQFSTQDNGNRQSWDTSQFNEPKLLHEFETKQSWTNKAIPPYKFIVHTNEFPEKDTPVFNNPITELSKYDASSFSVMSNTKPFTYFLQGMIFRVPRNNVLITHHSDLLSTLRESSVHGTKFKKHTLAEELTELGMATGGGLSTPSELIQQQHSGLASMGLKSRYNEILICGKPGVKLPHGMTGNLIVTGVFIKISKTGDLLSSFDSATRLSALKKHAARLDVPLLYLPDAP